VDGGVIPWLLQCDEPRQLLDDLSLRPSTDEPVVLDDQMQGAEQMGQQVVAAPLRMRVADGVEPDQHRVEHAQGPPLPGLPARIGTLAGSCP
jgi:hypothetical protein